MKRSAILAFPDERGEPLARLVLERVQLQPSDAPWYLRGEPPPTAAWLMCNPSTADHERDDPTAGRVMGHSARFGFPRSLIGNVWPLRTPYPADLFAALRDGRYLPEMNAANLDALAMIGAQSDVLVVAFGAEPGRKYRAAVEIAVEAYRSANSGPLYALGTTADGWPLHPLARGKLAIRRDAPLVPWALPT